MRLVEPRSVRRRWACPGFVALGAGQLGDVLGALSTDALDWHWILLVNILIGSIVYILSLGSARAEDHVHHGRRLRGVVDVTSALMSVTRS